MIPSNLGNRQKDILRALWLMGGEARSIHELCARSSDDVPVKSLHRRGLVEIHSPAKDQKWGSAAKRVTLTREGQATARTLADEKTQR